MEGRILLLVNVLTYMYEICSDPEGGQGVRTPPPLKNHKNIGFISNTGPDPLKNNKTTKPVLNVGPTLAHQRNAISMAFRWRADYGLILAVFGSPHQRKKQNKKKETPSKLDPL